MLNLIGINLNFFAFKTTPVHRLFPCSSSSSPAASTASNNSFTVSYLIDSCGFPSEKAISASKYLKFKTPDRADSVIAFFKDKGFNETQIYNLIRKSPKTLTYHPQKNLLPKFVFLNSIGLSDSDIFELFNVRPNFLGRSLKNHIEFNYNSLKDLLYQLDCRARDAIKSCVWILDWDIQAKLLPNMQILRDAGIHESEMVHLLTYHPRDFLVSTYHFKKVVEELVEMGFDPLGPSFMDAFHAYRSMSKSTWKKKMKTYKKWGLSKAEFVLAFAYYPLCMMVSDEKIDRFMDFFVNKMGFEKSIIAKNFFLIYFSLEERIIPRSLVYQHCLDNGLLKSKTIPGFIRFWLRPPEKRFIKRLERYEKEAPGVLKLYKETLDHAK